ncbi:MAG: potassium channel protein [Candidatus Omnitrophica bacterium]|nr:potassium channel protein [Candidatus Omnitrophota bacterium]
MKKIELPMIFLSFIWFCILITELVNGTNTVLSDFGTGIWFLFILYFAMRLATVANKIKLLKQNWLFVLAIFVTSLRFSHFLQSFPLVRVLTATFGIQMIWIFASAFLGIRILRRKIGHRGTGYVLALTFVVLFAGAAGMLHFEGGVADNQGIHTYWRALWWTAMQLTNMGSGYVIKTTGGRIICLGVSIYAVVIFGYITALLASFLIDREIKEPKAEIAYQKSVHELKEEIIQLRRLIEDSFKNGLIPKIKSK